VGGLAFVDQLAGVICCGVSSLIGDLRHDAFKILTPAPRPNSFTTFVRKTLASPKSMSVLSM